MKRIAAGSYVRLIACAALATFSVAGCGNSSGPTAGKSSPGPSPRERLEAMARQYQAAKTYQDAGELRFLVDGAPEDQYRSLPFSVAFVRPNKLRIHVLDTMSVSDGKLLRSMVQSLPGQVLVRKCPPTVDVAALASDEMLNDAMHGQLDVELPQWLLLTAKDPLARLTRDSTLKQLSDSEFLGQKCWRIELAGPDGRAVAWINKESGLLVKYEFPLDAIRKRFPLAGLWAEFRGAAVDAPIDHVAFEAEVPDDARLVKRFVMPPPEAPPAILAQPIDPFTFVALDGTALGPESLAGKVVVFDLWATWCGWCFEGLPLLEQVYQQYKDREGVEFLAVSKDDLTVTNAAVAEAFEKHDLSIPIVRDQEQVADRLFQLEGLPTTIVLGRDGTVQYYHVGYDPKLTETLPAVLDKLLAGENLAKPELDAYEHQKEEFEQRLSDVLVDANGQPAAEPEMAGKPGSIE